MTMSIVAHYHPEALAQTREIAAEKPVSFLNRLMLAIMESRRHQAYRDLKRFEAIYGIDLGGEGLKTPFTVKDLPFQKSGEIQ
jgi:hypothetical protein